MQEEPENMGAWEFVRPLLEETIDGRLAAALRRPRPQREPVGRLDGVAHDEPADADRRGVRPDARAHADAAWCCRSRCRRCAVRLRAQTAGGQVQVR